MAKHFVYGSYPSLKEADEAVRHLHDYGIEADQVQLGASDAVNESLKATRSSIHVLSKDAVGEKYAQAFDEDDVFVLVDEACHQLVIDKEGTADHPKGIELPSVN